MPYLACLPRLSFVPATAQQFRRSTYLNPLESPLKNQHFAFKTCQTIISESPAFECLPDNANTHTFARLTAWGQQLCPTSYLSLKQQHCRESFRDDCHSHFKDPTMASLTSRITTSAAGSQAQPYIKTTTLPSIRIFLAFLASPYLNHTTLFTSVGATYLTFLPCIIPAISCIHSST